MRNCDSFVYIPQYGVGTASLNVAVAASIILHHYAVWAGYEERSRTGFKFDVAERPHRTSARGTVPLSEEEIAELRAKRAAKRAAAEAELEGADRGGREDIEGEREGVLGAEEATVGSG